MVFFICMRPSFCIIEFRTTVASFCSLMDVQAAILCDFAAVYDGRLSIVGAFDMIAAAAFPVTHRHCAIGLLLRTGFDDCGGHRLTTRFLDADGVLLMPTMDMEILIHPLADDMFIGSQGFALTITNLLIPAPGIYRFDVSIDGENAIHLPMQVKRYGNQSGLPGD